MKRPLATSRTYMNRNEVTREEPVSFEVSTLLPMRPRLESVD